MELTPDKAYTCSNCGADVQGNFCQHCGQRQPRPTDFHFTEIMKQAFGEITDLDGTIWKTIHYLFRYPGKLTHDFLQGKRKQYINPFKLYLLASLLYFLVFSYSSKGTIVDLEMAFKLDLYGNTKDLVMQLWDPAKQSQEEFMETFIQATRDVNNLLLYSSILIFALFLKLWFIRRNIPYAVHLLFALHFLSFGFIREVICFPLMLHYKIPMIIILALHSLWYLYYALTLCYPQKRIRVLLNTVLIYLSFAFIFSNNLYVAIYITAKFW